MKEVIFFDLGNTLIKYYERNEFPKILEQAIDEVHIFLKSRNLCNIDKKEIWQRAEMENYEAKDYKVRPLEDRLCCIFRLNNLSQEFLMSMCMYFLRPIFSIAKIYDDTLSTLKLLKTKGYKLAIISNTAWGSPADFWREELRRFNISKYIDNEIYCRDIGWRKPSEKIFHFALNKLSTKPDQCLFIGDDPRWDIVGPQSVGIEAILIDRKNVYQDKNFTKISSLKGLTDLLV